VTFNDHVAISLKVRNTSKQQNKKSVPWTNRIPTDLLIPSYKCCDQGPD